MKIDDVDFRNMPQELVDFKDQIITAWNYGKFQKQVITGAPTWAGRRGEEVYAMSGTTGVLYVCASDNTTTWKQVAVFLL